MKYLTIALILVSIHGYSQKARVKKMRELTVLLGIWDVNTKMLPAPGQVIPETGTMTCLSLYDSTYIECNVTLTNGRGSRSYKQLVTYDPENSRYMQHYFYTGTPMSITETGQVVNGEYTTTTTFTSGGKTQTVTAIMKLERDLLSYESRSTAVNNEIDYTASFKRRKS